MQNQKLIGRMMLRQDWKLFFLLILVGPFLSGLVNAQVKLTIDAQTRNLDFEGPWKAGEKLSIQVTNLSSASFDSLAVTYRADEYTNTMGIAAFTGFNAKAQAK